MPSFGHSSQNGNDHSGTRDGYQEWGDSNIQDIVFVINLLAARYANQSSLAPGVTLDTLEKYYKAGYNAVRKYTSKCLCNPFQSFPFGISG
ncbi:hypothetical protein Patl1_27256 [Pistacia atlantica]|uniref:Uncharacterized protein n=1 Tax=Pistacia atlantica TaxID=434234 RepID=A0ACC1BBI0_9ROSI|nr:hypothetical protein Patl1_27256 [Pistacia atlantica]